MIIGLLCGVPRELDWMARIGTAMLSSKGLAKGGGCDFHSAGSAWRAGDEIEMKIHDGFITFSLNNHAVKTFNLPGGATQVGVSMWSAGTSLEIMC